MPGQMKADDLEQLVTDAKRAIASGGDPPEEATGITIDDLDDEEGGVVPAEEGVPEWALVPANFSFPPGWLVWFIRFPASMTNRPKGPERQCILWNLSEADEKRASKLARGDGIRVIDEMAKAMIRSIDGKKVSWKPVDPRAPADETGNVSQFWTEIGGKCRHQLKSLYLKTHAMDGAENARFFESCITPRTVG